MAALGPRSLFVACCHRQALRSISLAAASSTRPPFTALGRVCPRPPRPPPFQPRLLAQLRVPPCPAPRTALPLGLRITLRSSGAPTACHQGPAGGTRYIFASRALVACRRRPLTSDVMPDKDMEEISRDDAYSLARAIAKRIVSGELSEYEGG